MPRKDNYILPAELGILTPTEWDAKGKAAVLAWQPMAERYRRADTYTRGRKHQPVLLAQVHPDRWPSLAAYLAEHPNTPGYDGWPPTITRSHAARLSQMQAMKAQSGPLVLLRLDLGRLDALPLHSRELVDAARPLIDELHAELLHPDTPYTLSVQRASCTHSHAVVPLSGLLAEHSALVRAACSGAGGGCLLLEGRAHAVLIEDDEEDLEKVARYVTRDPDARLDVPGDSDDYFDALEDMLTRRQAPGHRRVRLSWKGSTPSKRLTLSPLPEAAAGRGAVSRCV